MGTGEKGEEEVEVGMGSVDVVATTDDSHTSMADRATFRHSAEFFSGIRFQTTRAPNLLSIISRSKIKPRLIPLMWQGVCAKIMFHFQMNYFL